VLFLLRPRQTWMPYALPRSRPQQEFHNEQLHQAYTSTRRASPPALDAGATPRRDSVADLKAVAQLRDSGALTEAEFAAAKAKILGAQDPES
jgi:Short C-terminal domain